MQFFINVILPLSLDKIFTYTVNKDEYLFLKPGMRVAVPFGKTKVYTALVYEKHQQKPLTYEPKEISQIIDAFPIVTEKQLEFWQWISEYYMSNLGEIYKTALPNGLILENQTLITSQFATATNEVSDEEYLILEALQETSAISIDEVVKIIGKKNVFPIIQSLIHKKLVSLFDEVKEVYKPKEVKYISLHSQYEDQHQMISLLQELDKSKKQKELVLHFFQLKALSNGKIKTKSLLESSEISPSVLKSLMQKNIFVETTEIEDRINFIKDENFKIELSDSQQKALLSIKTNFLQKNVNLLHGVTASGKTEIYIKLIEEYLEENKQTLFLLPEIALTTQLVNRLTAYFGNKVSVFHSKFNSNERIEVWQNVLQNSPKAQIIIGVRSALFLPFQNLGLILIDEEHESSYKQTDPSPRYQARDTAIMLSVFHGAKVLLGSATPSLETYFNVKIGKYLHTELFERYNNLVMPEIHLINLKEKYKTKQMDGHFSTDLKKLIAEKLEKKEQVVILQNRRGYSNFIECNSCGHVPQCPSCDVSLTYYKYKNALKCHYCGYSIAKPVNCFVCHSPDVSQIGFGTEQVEQELKQFFPDVKIARLDQDTTRGKNAFDKIFSALKNNEIDILVGTQMLAKGLDFENVTLACVLNADNLLNQPNYRAHERAYQLMTQMAGRAGRSTKPGMVAIQTYDPFHPIIQQVVNMNYNAMFNQQVLDRQTFKYSPFYKIIQIRLKHKNFETLRDGANWMAGMLKNQLAVEVLGPEEPAINKIRNEYIKVIMIKMLNNSNVATVKTLLKRQLESFDTISQYRSIKVNINVDY